MGGGSGLRLDFRAGAKKNYGADIPLWLDLSVDSMSRSKQVQMYSHKTKHNELTTQKNMQEKNNINTYIRIYEGEKVIGQWICMPFLCKCVAGRKK